MLKPISLKTLVQDALMKDQGVHGDVTTLAVVDERLTASAKLVVKAKGGIISGLGTFELVMRTMDPHIEVEQRCKNGTRVTRGEVVAVVTGPARSILTAERVALEFVRRASGIATRTAEFVNEVKGTDTGILDTRKIMPCFGELDKRAVRDGGGANHRVNLSEMGLIKNNHIDLVGGVGPAVTKFRNKYPTIPLEVEVRDMDELTQALAAEPERIMLDNMTVEQIGQAVKMRDKSVKEIPLEASGNMTLDRVRAVAETGVEFISVGELTHSVTAFDLSLHITILK